MNLEAITISCASCGGALDITEGKGVVKCAYCDMSSVLPRFVTKEKQEAYNSAVRYRRAREFDKATNIFERLLADFSDDAELHWSLLMCKYGVVFVDDPRTGTTHPTLLRMQNKPFIEDEEYKLALQNARDDEERNIYKGYAETIKKIQDKYYNIAESEKPFDIFISYKESDVNGQRTEDSLIAHHLYDKLTAKGYKVFYSRMSLKEVVGEEYEPYIYAALNSAKLMILVSTKMEYLESIWVKNEWSRFLQMMEKDTNKHIIIAYKSLNPYEFPNELRGIQGANLSIAGSDMDLISAADKYIAVKSQQHDDKKAAKKLMEYIEGEVLNGNFSEAHNVACDYLKQYDDTTGMVHIYRLLADNELKTLEELMDSNIPFINSGDFKYALINSQDSNIKDKLETMQSVYLENKKRDELIQAKSDYINKIYYNGLKLIDSFKIRKIKKGITELEKIKHVQNVPETIKKARSKIRKIRFTRIRKLLTLIAVLVVLFFTLKYVSENYIKAKDITANFVTDDDIDVFLSQYISDKMGNTMIWLVLLGPLAAALISGAITFFIVDDFPPAIGVGILGFILYCVLLIIGLDLICNIPGYATIMFVIGD